MSKYYFFNSLTKVFRIGAWFYNELGDVAYLNNVSPVVFTIDNVTYTAECDEETGKIFCTVLCGSNSIPISHKRIIEKVEKYLNVIENTFIAKRKRT